MAVFAGGATLDAVADVCNPDDDLGVDTLEAVSSLVDHSLVQQTASVQGEARYTMLETMREFARIQIEEQGEAPQARDRHRDYFLAVAEGAAGSHPEDQAAWLDSMEAEHDNLRAALESSKSEDLETGLRLAAALATFWHVRSYKDEGRR